MKYYYCKHCGNVIEYAVDSGVKVVCCGEEMHELTANTKDAAQEKHVPVVTRNGNVVTVKVGSVLHPMVPEHFIMFISIMTKQGYQRKNLQPGVTPEATFALAEGDELVEAYEYCNIHGLWKA